MLTYKQYEILRFIKNHLQERGIAPSFDEMREAMGLRSKSGVHRLIRSLEERGFLRRLPHRARALEVIKMPEGHTSGFGAPTGRGTRLERLTARRGGGEAQVSSVAVPLMGRIAAGGPIEAIQMEEGSVHVPESVLRAGTHYALRVGGDSMMGAGILDDDIAIIQKTDTALNGEIVVAVIEGQEATLKRLRRKGDSIALEAENPAYETRIYGNGEVSVQGRLIGLFRKY